MRYICRQCGALGPDVACDACGHDGGVRARVSGLLARGGRAKYQGRRRERWWHLPKFKG